MKMKKFKVIFSLVCVFTLLIGSSSVYAKGDNVKQINERILSAEKIMEKDGIDLQTKNLLIEKISRGEKLDSEKEDVNPVDVSTYKEDDYNVIKETYPDNSYIITKTTDVQSVINEHANTRSSWNTTLKSGTVISSSSMHTRVAGAKVIKSAGAYSASFKFDYITVRSGASEVERVYGQNGVSGGGTMSLGTPRIVKRTDEYGTPARAEMGFDFSGYGGIGSYSGVVGITLTRSGPNSY